MFGGWAGVRRCVLCNVIKEGRSTQPALDHQPDCVVGKVQEREREEMKGGWHLL